MPTRHGMTSGELARTFNAENKIGADLVVVEPKTGAATTLDPTAHPRVTTEVSPP